MASLMRCCKYADFDHLCQDCSKNEQCFGVQYSRDHAGAIVRKMGWSQQKPEEKASQRDEEAITTWKTERWEALKKSPGGNPGSTEKRE